MLIYKQYDQAALDRQYNNRLQVPDFATHLDRWESLSRQTEKDYKVAVDISYGKLLRQKLDIYPSLHPRSRTLIFIHGGYWQKFDKANFQFIAKAFYTHNITTVIINYPLGPSAPVDEIVASCIDAVRWLYNNVEAYNGDPTQLYIAGHSAGAQLAAMVLATNWKQFDLAGDVIKGACVISGIFNLIPIRLSYLNQSLRMDTTAALRNSPVQLVPSVLCPLTIVVGSNETDEFLDQSRELYNCWKENIPAEIMELPGLNHFSILETVLDPASELYRLMSRLMKI
jgi:arylformamidase